MYLLFAGDTYYPYGGINDFKGRYNSLELAKQAAQKFDWAHIVRAEDFIEIWEK